MIVTHPKWKGLWMCFLSVCVCFTIPARSSSRDLTFLVRPFFIAGPKLQTSGGLHAMTIYGHKQSSDNRFVLFFTFLYSAVPLKYTLVHYIRRNPEKGFFFCQHNLNLCVWRGNALSDSGRGLCRRSVFVINMNGTITLGDGLRFGLRIVLFY